MTENKELIYLTPNDALLFVKFQKHFALIQVIDSLGGFDIKSGSMTIHFNALGQISSVDKNEHFKV